MGELSVMFELIERQMTEAVRFHQRAKVLKHREKDSDRAFDAVWAMNERLLQIVQNQQQQIETLLDRIVSAEVDITDLIDANHHKGGKKK